jgi:hypothetical protein
MADYQQELLQTKARWGVLEFNEGENELPSTERAPLWGAVDQGLQNQKRLLKSTPSSGGESLTVASPLGLQGIR